MNERLKDLGHIIHERGLRLTSQRLTIARLAMQKRRHFTADDLLDSARKLLPGVSRATVYRTLGLLSNLGFVSGMDFGDGRLCYEPSPRSQNEHHDHLICLGCGRITEFNCPEIESLQQDVALREGFRVQRHSLKLFGCCSDCQAKGKGNGC